MELNSKIVLFCVLQETRSRSSIGKGKRKLGYIVCVNSKEMPHSCGCTVDFTLH
jgi:hypothetical protein